MILVDFGEVFLACKDRLKDHQLRAIDPRSMWWRHEDAYIATTYKEGILWVDWVIASGPGWLRDFVKGIRGIEGCSCVEFMTEEGSGVESFVKYYKGQTLRSEDTYPNGKRIIYCRIPVKSTRFSNG